MRSKVRGPSSGDASLPATRSGTRSCQSGRLQCAVQPPSIGNAAPVTEAPLSLHRNKARAASSVTSMKRLLGWFFSNMSEITLSRAMPCALA